MKFTLFFVCLIPSIFSKPTHLEESGVPEAQLLGSTNPESLEQIPLDKRGIVRDSPSLTSSLKSKLAKYISQRERRSQSMALDKRDPWTSAWANILYKPKSLTKGRDTKRSAWGTPWESFLKSQQGFRLNDGDNNFLNNAVMYKRGERRHIQELNSVPMIGKRDPEVYSFDEDDDSNWDYDNWFANFDNEDWDSHFQEDGPIFADASLYPPVVGPHYRTILTRVQ
ncbi:uncharacterized protein LOC111709325 isoform X2 [Eurytemora carolleeae]|uniref:uncharacterized protein LOC111709325 isoform X2 n=1 Tax=Eurytemora carolleeae TaxID=1294199 RepID=UPI000C78C4DD|nr:uncharacterized protein LOC111709325 isoform X2 [Eurytemora carolleeae]|eukprot:XP_023338736.1 uncharacterized protein LOC111709325 isoform X2 [Eurytemora affinis]